MWLPLPVEGPYDYLVPEDMTLRAGAVVEVPLGRRFEIGVVWGPGSADLEAKRLKSIVQALPVPAIAVANRRFVDWVSAYTLQPLGAVLRMVINPARRWKPKPAPSAIALTGTSLAALGLAPTLARGKVLAAFSDRSVFETAAALARAAKVSSGVVRDMLDKGALKAVSAQLPQVMGPDPNRAGPRLEPAQAAAAATLTDAVGQGFSVTLLEGVTGSGKTEVYFEAIAAALKRGQQVLVLLPEIALTAQWLERFVRRFRAPPAMWHSDMVGRMRRETRAAVTSGEARVVVGARSALFLPFPDLGLVVVDEEHDSAFKQEDGVIYHARDMAVVRARESGAPVILSSATPSLETVLNTTNQRYRRVHLPSRFGAATLPKIEVLDLRRHKPEKGPWGRAWLAPPLVASVSRALAEGEQTLLFLNRRGYAPLTLCNACGHRLHCPTCSAWLVEHRLSGRLQCHHCGYAARRPESCSSCGATNSFVACGPGIERLAEEAAARWPSARVRMVASDTLDRPSAIAELIDDILKHRLDIVVGTQVLAKGHHFPNLTLVGVVDADLGLSSWDLRAAERTYQLLHQVAGRAGRAGRPGTVLIQTHDPSHPVMQALAAADTESFLAREADSRRLLAMPPFGRLAALIVSGPDEHQVSDVGRRLAQTAPRDDGVEVLGPAPAVMALLRGRHRHRLLLKAGRDIRVQPLLADWLARVKVPGGVRVQVDVDPYSFY
ncbi:MAG: primosomal protein N' [Alphaproteobacteria bacterium]|nr:primosomal protein N' [Alphaproteobacteria bacterium]